MRFVDLSVPIVSSPDDTPEVLKTEIAFEDHAAGVRVIQAMFGVGPELLRDGEGWANDFFTRLGTHNSTHVDAPGPAATRTPPIPTTSPAGRG